MREAHDLAGELNELRRMAAIPKTPEAVKFFELSSQVETLAARAAAREAELERVVATAREHGKVQLAHLRALHQVSPHPHIYPPTHPHTKKLKNLKHKMGWPS